MSEENANQMAMVDNMHALQIASEEEESDLVDTSIYERDAKDALEIAREEERAFEAYQLDELLAISLYENEMKGMGYGHLINPYEDDEYGDEYDEEDEDDYDEEEDGEDGYEVNSNQGINLLERPAKQVGDGDVVDVNKVDEDDEFEFVSSYDEEENTCDGKPPSVCYCCRNDLSNEAEYCMVPCGHWYCLKCISVRCKMGIRDRSMIPAHCCHQVFPLDIVNQVLTVDEMTVYTRDMKGHE